MKLFHNMKHIVPSYHRIAFIIAVSLMVLSICHMMSFAPNIWAQQAAKKAGAHPGLPLTDFNTSRFSGSGNCALCHSSLRDDAGNDVSIDAHWSSTMMANSAKDPLWQAKVSSEIARNPDLSKVIEDKCATCHMPMSRIQAKADGAAVAVTGKGFLGMNHALRKAAMDGVSCTLCHQIQGAGLGTKSAFNGGFLIDTGSAPPDRLIYGPFPNPVQNMMRMRVGYTPVEGLQVKDPALCGACHTLYTPYVDAAGKVLGEFPEQTPYLEWKHSKYGNGVGQGKSCQACHMPHAKGPVVISNRPRGRGRMSLMPRSPFGKHYFAGGNLFMLNILRENTEELGITASSQNLDLTAERTTIQLQAKTAKLSIVQARFEGNELLIKVNIKNMAGHKFPTGFPSRRAWIHLEVRNPEGEIVFESGRVKPDGGIMGNDADVNAAAYEPHHKVISSPDQVQIYESIMENSDGQVTYTLLRGAKYVKDNRLLPNGFNKDVASRDIAVWGSALKDNDFVDGSDLVEYRIKTKRVPGSYKVSVDLLYQPVSFRFARDLFEGKNPLIDRFESFYHMTDKKTVLLETSHYNIN